MANKYYWVITAEIAAVCSAYHIVTYTKTQNGQTIYCVDDWDAAQGIIAADIYSDGEVTDAEALTLGLIFDYTANQIYLSTESLTVVY